MPSSGSDDPQISLLYVDDEPGLLEVVKAFLEQKTGIIRVDTQETAADALRLLERQSYDAIVSDYQMPDMDGIAFLKVLRERGHTTPFIIFTGKGREEVVIEAFDAGADFYIRKGDDPKSGFAGLERKVRKAVDLHREEKASRESVEKYRLMIDRASQMLFLHDQHGAFLDVNQKTIENTGYSREELLSMNVTDIDPDVHLHPFTQWLWQEAPLQEEKIFETRHRRKDGSIYPAEVHASRVKIAGEPCILALATDITSRRQEEEALRESEEMFRGIIENLQDIYYRTDAHGIITMLSPSAAKILGYDTTDAIIGKPGSDFWAHPEDRMEIVRRIAEEGRVQDYEVTLKKADGGLLPVSVSCRQLYDVSGKAAGVEGIIRDITQRKEAEERLKESEEKFRALVENAFEGILILDMQGTIFFANKAAAETGEVDSPAELIGRQVLEFIAPESHEAVLSDFVEVARGHDAFPAIYNAISARGKKFILESIGKTISYEGSPAILLSIRDRTKEEQANTALRESEEKYRLIADNTADTIWIADLNLNIQYISPSVQKMRGYTPEEVMGQSLQEMLTPDSFDSVQKQFSEEMALESTGNADPKRTISIEFEKYRKDGTTILVENAIRFLRDQDGRPTGIIGVSRDITERRKAEKEKERNEYRFSLLASQARAYTWEVDPEGLYISISPECEAITGYKPEEIIGRMHFYDLHPEENREEFKRVAMEFFARRESFREFENSAIRKSGELFWVITSGIPLVDDSGCLIGYWGTDTDVTERKLAEDALQAANKKLQLLASITRHDIQNKIMILQAYLDLTRPEVDDPKLSKYLSEVDRAGSDIQRQIEFTRTYQELGVKRADWHTIEDLIASIADSGPPLFIDCIGYQILADQMVAKVFHNLMDNTIRHAEGVSRVEIRCEERDRQLTIIWEDDGPGIPDDQKERIFERGYGEISGLGLFLSREILAITEITIAETGEYGKGARFEMLVPAGAWQKNEGNS